MADSERLAHESAALEYIKHEPFEQFRMEVQELVDSKNAEELEARFGKRIAFGTAGLRSKMGGGIAYMNDLIITQTTQGLISYVEQNVENAAQRGIMIQYDGRYHSKRFAELTAAVAQSRGWTVYWFNKMGATPFVPFGVIHFSCACGVMVTASHNPKEYNGYKVYWGNGAQIIPPHDKGITASILENLTPWQTSFEFQEEAAQDVTAMTTELYFKAISEKYCWQRDQNAESAVNIAYTAMHGIGGAYMVEAFESFGLKPFFKVEQQFEPDPDFSTVAFPNPEEGKTSLVLSFETAEANDCPIIFANDPDADRIAVAEKQESGWRVLNGNEIAALMADHVWQHHDRFGDDAPENFLMVASTVSSKYLARMAEVEGFKFEDTLTGWKWMGNVASKRVSEGMTFLFGYEVEIGFAVGSVSYDKDGIRCACIFAELVDRLYREGKTCAQRLEELYAKYGYFEMTASYFFYDGAQVLSDIFGELRRDGDYVKACGDYNIVRVRDVTTGYDSGEPGFQSKMPVMADSQMITFYFENGAVATMRNSGTEPKLKYYLECRHLSNQSQAHDLMVDMEKALVENFIQPEKYQLRAKPS